MIGQGGGVVDWLRISLVILGVILIAGIWFAHRLRTANRRRLDDVYRDDWDGDDAVRIRAVPEEADPETRGETMSNSWEGAGIRDHGFAEHASSNGQSPVVERAEPILESRIDRGSSDMLKSSPTSGPAAVKDEDGWGGPPPARRNSAARSLGSWIAKLRGRQSQKAVGMEVSPNRPGRNLAGPEALPATQVEQKPLWEGFDDISAPRVVGRNPLSGDEHADVTEEQVKILLLHVVAPRNRPFTGVAIGAALRRAGLELGEFAIYHFRDAEGRPLFSAANMVAPGTLRDADLLDMTTPGLSLFMQVHRAQQPHTAFERWLEKTHQLARDLGGSILDAQQSTATNQTLAHMREDMNQWLLRHRPDVLRRKH